MADKTERIVVEVLTAANVGQIEGLATSFGGFGLQTALLIAAIAVAIEVGKQSIDNTRKQERSINDLNQAIAVFNDGYGKAIPLGEKQIAALQKARDGYDKAKDELTLFNLEHQKRAKTQQQQEVVDFRRRQLEENLTKAQQELTDAEAEGATQKQTAVIYQEGMNRELDAFLEKNKQFISDQYDTREALAAAIRAGNDSTTSMRLLNDALDLAAIKHISVSDAMHIEILSLNGNSKGLRDLGISSDDYNAIMKSTLTTEQKHQALLELIEERTGHGRDTTDKLQQTQNKLNKDWQDFTVQLGGIVLPVVDWIINAADIGLNALEALPHALQQFFEGGSTTTGSRASQFGHRAGGGPVEPGGVYTVGERGPETLVMGSGSRAMQLHVHVDRGFFIDPASVDRLADAIVRTISQTVYASALN